MNEKRIDGLERRQENFESETRDNFKRVFDKVDDVEKEYAEMNGSLKQFGTKFDGLCKSVDNLKTSFEAKPKKIRKSWLLVLEVVGLAFMVAFYLFDKLT